MSAPPLNDIVFHEFGEGILISINGEIVPASKINEFVKFVNFEPSVANAIKVALEAVGFDPDDDVPLVLPSDMKEAP